VWIPPNSFLRRRRAHEVQRGEIVATHPHAHACRHHAAGIGTAAAS
jgi:hypothetical protein